jgi:hypothetical protein
MGRKSHTWAPLSDYERRTIVLQVGFLFLGPRCANYPDVSTLATNDLLGSEVMTQQLNPNQSLQITATIFSTKNHWQKRRLQSIRTIEKNNLFYILYMG